jgi:hypothetical protein
MSEKFRLTLALLAIASGVAGCFYPPTTQPPAASKTQTVVPVPYDLTWDAVHDVVLHNDYKVQGDDPDHGIVEAEGHTFTLSAADCGQLKSIAGRYDAEPLPGASAVYNIKVEPAGPQSTDVAINATYNTPIHVPFHPVRDFQCVSRGVEEARLLNEIEIAARTERRPEKAPAEQSAPRRMLTPGRPTLLRPELIRPGPQN